MKRVILLATAAAIFTSCSDSQFKGYTKAETGLHYKFFTQNEDGPKIQDGDGLLIRYIISRQDNDSVIVDSKNVSQDGSGYIPFGMRSSFVGSFEDGMKMMTKGDSAEFIISADSFFLKTIRQNELPAGFKPGQFVKGVFKIKDVQNKADREADEKKQMAEQEAQMKEMEEKERPSMDKFIAENNITVKPTASGIYYIEVKKGSGANPKATDIVKVHYTGKFLDGRVFDSSVERGEPIEFALNEVVPGWTEGLQMMRKGGKANLLIPSAMAYGPGGRQGIPPFSPLFFEVELIDIKSGPANTGSPAENK